MNNPPSYMSLSLEDSNVQEDIAKIIQDMSRIRTETIVDRNITDKQKDEYLHLASRLAAGIEGLSTQPMVERMQWLVGKIDKDRSLFSYDPRQDQFWMRKDKEFIRKLDDLLFCVAKDGFQSSEEKHHVVQALKYLGGKGEPAGERLKIYDSILPFGGGVPIPEKEGICRRVMGMMLGSHYHIDRIDDLTVHVEGDLENLEALVDEFGKRGYTAMRFHLYAPQLNELRRRYPNAAPRSGRRSIQAGTDAPNRAASAIFRYTKPISVPILGLMPEYFRRKVDSIVHGQRSRSEYSSDDSKTVGISAGCEMACGTAMIGLGIAYNPALIFTGAGAVIEGIVRLCMLGDDDVRGTLPAKLALLPLEEYLKDRDRIRDNLTYVEIPIGLPVASAGRRPDPLEYFVRICRMQVPFQVEQNLTLSIDNMNHHQFGKIFADHVAQSSAEIMPADRNFDVTLDREHELVLYRHTAGDSVFRKDIGLFCFHDRRYIVTTITDAQDTYVPRKRLQGKATGSAGNDDNLDKEPKDAMQTITGILYNESAPEKHIEQITAALNPRYMHFRRYEHGALTDDKELMPL